MASEKEKKKAVEPAGVSGGPSRIHDDSPSPSPLFGKPPLSKTKASPSSVFSDLIDVMDIAMWELDLQYRVVTANKKARKVYGEDVVGEYCYAAAAKLNHVCPDCPAKKVYEGHPSGRSEHRRTDVSGNPFYIDHIATPIRGESGETVGSLVLIIDITERKRMERELKRHRDKLEDMVDERTKALKHSEERYRSLYNESKKAEAVYRSLIHSSADAIVIYDLEGKTRYVSPVFTQIFGWTLEELRGKRIPYMPESERRASMEQIEDVTKRGVLCQGFETKRLTKDGKAVDVSISASMFSDHQGEPSGLLVILRDISDKKVLETRIRQSQKMEAVGTLAGGVAHDFNNILSIVLGNADLALSVLEKGAPVASYIEGIRTASLRARDVIRQLLSFSRRSEERRAPLRIAPVVRESMKLLRSSIPSDIEIRETIGDESSAVLTEPTQIHQILINLCTNAAHAMAEKGGTLDVRLEKAEVPAQGSVSAPELAPGEYLRISVDDDGCGIPPGDQERIFEPYFTTKEVGKGTGMGLAVVHGIVRGSGGVLKVTSELGRGTRFDVYLPVVEEERAPDARPEAQYPKGEERILVVDDDEAILAVEEQILSLLGYRVESFADPAKALGRIAKADSPFDLVIADMTMPQMTGDVFLRRAMDASPGISTVLCTGFSERIDEEAAAKMGIDKYLVKPIKMHRMAGVIRDLLDRKKN